MNLELTAEALERTEAADVLEELLECHCDEAWTKRGLHEANSVHRDYADELVLAIAALRQLAKQ